MRKIILICFALIIGLIAFGQPVVNRAGASNTVSDARWQAQLNAFLPRYNDTISANLQRGIDSAGAVIYTRNPQVMWYRANNPKRWVQFLDSASASSLFVDSILVTHAPKMDSLWQLKNGTLSLVNIFDKQCGIIQPGSVVNDSLLYYTISNSIYILCSDGIRRTSVTTQVQLATADATYDRIDAIILDSSGVNTLTGDPSADPQTPQINPDQLLLTYILVPAGATSPPSCTTTDLTIYDENVEWAGGTSGVSVDFNSTTTPYHGVKDAFINGTGNNYYISFTGSPIIPSAFTTLELHVNVGVQWIFFNNPSLNLEWFNGATSVSNVVSISNGGFGFNKNATDQWQTIIIPVSGWTFSATTANRLRITFKKGGSSLIGSPFYLDYIRLGGACIQQPPTTAGSYINNQTNTQKNANFNIDGNGTIGGLLKLPSYDSTTRNDGALTKALGTDEFGNVILGRVNTGLTVAYDSLFQTSDTSFALQRNDLTRDTVVVAWAAGDKNQIHVESWSNLTIVNNTIDSAQLKITGVTEGTYTNATIRVNDKGQVTYAANGTSGTIVANRHLQFQVGVSPNATTMAGASYFLLPSGYDTMFLKVYREGFNEVDSTNGIVSYQWIKHNDTLFVYPNLADSERIAVDAYLQSNWTADVLPSPPGYDADAQAYFDAVATNTGTLSTPEKNAINAFVVGLKADGIWTGFFDKMHFTIESAKVGEINLFDPTGTKATFVNSPTFASTGVTLNGTNQYINSHWIGGASIVATDNNYSISAYERTTGATTGTLWGVVEAANGSNMYLYPYMSGNIYWITLNISQFNTAASTGAGLFSGMSTSSGANSKKFYRDGTNIWDLDDNGSGNTLPDVQALAFGATNSNATINEYRACEIFMYATGKSRTSTQETNFKNRVATLATAF